MNKIDDSDAGNQDELFYVCAHNAEMKTLVFGIVAVIFQKQFF